MYLEPGQFPRASWCEVFETWLYANPGGTFPIPDRGRGSGTHTASYRGIPDRISATLKRPERAAGRLTPSAMYGALSPLFP
jgi:hypothetical protein